MDTSKEYINMCEKAKEIQRQHDFSGAPGFVGLNYGVCNAYYGFKIDYNTISHVWLPYQDQLQDIVNYSIASLVYSISDFISENGWLRDSIDYIRTMEQLWLAFVMKEKYNKIWNGKEWIEND